MLRSFILSKYQRSMPYLYLTARQVNRFYVRSFSRPTIPSVPWKTLRHTDSLMTYLWDIYEEIEMLDVMQEDTTTLKSLYDRLQGLLDYSV